MQATSQTWIRKLSAGLIIGLLVGLLVLGLESSGLLERYSLQTLDLLFQKALPSRPGAGDIVLIEVDQASLDFYQSQGLTWPWPRQMYAPIIDYCWQAGATAIIFDILFTEGSSYGQEDDLRLAQSLDRAANGFLPLFFTRNPRKDNGLPPEGLQNQGLSVAGQPPGEDPGYQSVMLPVPPLRAAAAGLGNVEARPDSDGVYRRLTLLVPFQGRWWPQLAMAAYLHHYRVKSLAWQPRGLQLESTAPTKTRGTHFSEIIPLLPDGGLLLKYRPGARPYRRYVAANVIQSYVQSQAGEQPIHPLSDFSQKWVLVGLTAPGLYDLKATPLSPIYPGVAIQATLLDNLLNRDFLVPLPRVGAILLTLGISLTAALTVLWVPALWLTLLSLIGYLALIMTLAVLLFVTGVWLDAVPPLVAVVFAFGVSAAYSYSTEGRQKRVIRRTFAHYMSDTLIQDLLKNPDKLRLGGERREMTIFFSDLAGFTSLSEGLSPEELVSLLNEYLTQMTDIILARGGIIDKYEGDAIMAFWGAPLSQPDHAARACLAALEQQRQLSKLRSEWQSRGLPQFSARMGINTGEVVVGNLGSNTRFDFTVIGDAVNLASRLEGANKSYDSGILISETTAVQAEGQVELRELDLLAVKGRATPVRVYEVLAPKGQLEAVMVQVRELFAQGLALYRQQRWTEAQALFQQVLELCPLDGPAQKFLARCQTLVGQNLGPDWDGVFRLTTK
ncbi:MAG: adenylate/guanylate cyclase domain-containing protein [Deltaproteobacteria bacterium]|nr:MAG: adenylate/guanylate cyclase domain-containing protein [Deltaproteobacteria bacterium]